MEINSVHTLDASFAVLELCLQRLTQIAPVESPSQILELIPELPLPARRLILSELIKSDMNAYAQGSGNSIATSIPTRETQTRLDETQQFSVRSLEFYWPAVGVILPLSDLPFDLVLEEVQLRRAAGEQPKWEDYRQRFPGLVEPIRQWLAAEKEGASNSQPLSNRTGKVPELPVDEIVDDFQLLKQLGQGAFASVYLAKQLSMQRLVALKVSGQCSDEPRALSQLDHANIVRVYDQREITQPPAVLLYMQYVAGGTLADCINRIRDLPPALRTGATLLASVDQNLLNANQFVPEQSATRALLSSMDWPRVVAWIGIQLAQGLGYAASKRVLHRDVKPANILLSSEGIPKLADFNVSCSGLSGRAGAAAYFGGSLAYMSPEQLRVADPTDPWTADQLDGRSDLYSLGMVLWELWQAKRPWLVVELADNWTEAVSLQREIRSSSFAPLNPSHTATERVLEKVLRSLLSVDPDARPQTGQETAARLKLALEPNLAARFEPAPQSLTGWLLRAPVLLLAGLIIFGPNTAASIFNYDYNHRRMAQWSDDPSMLSDFIYVSNWVNGVVYPLGLILFLIIMLPIARIVRRGKQGCVASASQIAQLWNIGNKATLICGILWAVSGLVFAVTFSSLHSDFNRYDALHFFFSLVLCGGVAWIYPYFGMTLLAVLVYYPTVIAPSMHDPQLTQRCKSACRHSRWYLLSAAAIPLTAVGALVFRQDLPANLILAGICVTALGLVASFFAHQKLEQSLPQFTSVLASEEAWRP